MLKICLGLWKSESQYAYKRYAYNKNVMLIKKNMYQQLYKIDVANFCNTTFFLELTSKNVFLHACCSKEGST